MNKKKTLRTAVELGKDVLILLLTCSALWLAGRSQLLAPLMERLDREERLPEQVAVESDSQLGAVRPARICVNLVDGHAMRCGLQHDPAAVDELFEQIAPTLVEALSGLNEARRVEREDWEAALLRRSFCLDFQGEFPLCVLAGWLSGQRDVQQEFAVRRLVLVPEEQGTTLYYRDEGTGEYYRCPSATGGKGQLEQILTQLADNGAFFAFESELYADVDPDTLLHEGSRDMTVYAAANPVSGGQTSLEELMQDVGIPIVGSSFYTSGSEHVARSAEDTIRLSHQGVLEYQSGGEGSFLVVSQQRQDDLFQCVESCRELVNKLAGKRCGDAGVYLSHVRRDGQGMDVCFEYRLSGTQVSLQQDHAARFHIENGRITYFRAHLRSYQPTAQTTPVMPPLQAAAALGAMELEGEELQIVYYDVGSDSVQASWAAPLEGGEV